MLNPHQYQIEARNTLLSKLQQHNSVLLISPIASGKTYIAADTANIWLQNSPTDNILIIVNRIPLILQTYETLNLFNNNHAIIHGELKYDLDGNKINNIAKIEKKVITGVKKHNKQILTTTVETFKNILKFMPNYKPNLIIFDEAHKSTSEGYQFVRDMYPEAKILGLTATPYRANIAEGECLYEDWYGNNVVETISIKELIELGQLVQPKYIKLNQDSHIVNSWIELTKNEENRRTLIFCDRIAYAVELVKAFQQSGIASEVITTSNETCEEAKEMTVLQRNQVYRKFRDGEIDVLISVMALCEGFNEPSARICFLLRNAGGDDANNPALYTQTVGRVLRPYADKQDAIIVDFRDNVSRYGAVEDWDWNIEEQGRRQSKSVIDGQKMLQSDYEANKRIYVTCGKCAHVYDMKKHSYCYHCGKDHNVKICMTKAELYQIDRWAIERRKEGRVKPGRVNGLHGQYSGWARGRKLPELDLTVFGECMGELEKLGLCKKMRSFQGIKAIWYQIG